MEIILIDGDGLEEKSIASVLPGQWDLDFCQRAMLQIANQLGGRWQRRIDLDCVCPVSLVNWQRDGAVLYVK